MICRPLDFANPTTLKNHNELLRMFEILGADCCCVERWSDALRFSGRNFLDTVLHFVVSRFQLKERDTRIGSLITLRHFVNAMGQSTFSICSRAHVCSLRRLAGGQEAADHVQCDHARERDGPRGTVVDQQRGV
jgi:hypothetical protein